MPENDVRIKTWSSSSRESGASGVTSTDPGPTNQSDRPFPIDASLPGRVTG
jgi:hypothetical protein